MSYLHFGNPAGLHQPCDSDYCKTHEEPEDAGSSCNSPTCSRGGGAAFPRDVSKVIEQYAELLEHIAGHRWDQNPMMPYDGPDLQLHEALERIAEYADILPTKSDELVSAIEDVTQALHNLPITILCLTGQYKVPGAKFKQFKDNDIKEMCRTLFSELGYLYDELVQSAVAPLMQR
jgi:hypothetical protein